MSNRVVGSSTSERDVSTSTKSIQQYQSSYAVREGLNETPAANKRRFPWLHGGQLYSIRIILVIAFVLQALFLLVIVMVLSDSYQTRGVFEQVQVIRELVLSDVKSRVSVLLQAPFKTLPILGSVIERNLNILQDYNEMSRLTFSLAKANPEALLIMIATDESIVGFVNGFETALKIVQWANVSSELLYAFPSNTTDGVTPLPDPSSIHPIPYNVSERVWYKQGVSGPREGSIIPPFFDSSLPDQLFVGAVLPIVNQTNDEVLGVVTYQSTLQLLSNYLEATSFLKRGVTFIIDKSGFMVADSTPNSVLFVSYPNGTSVRSTPFDSKNGLVRRTARAIERAHGHFFNITDYDIHQLYLKDWKLNIQYVALGQEGIDWIIVLVTMDSEFSGPIEKTRIVIGVTSACTSVVAGVVSIVFSILITAPLKRLGVDMEKIANMNFNVKLTEKSATTFYEVRRLQHQFHKMKSAITHFGRYVPLEVVKILLQSKTGTSLGLRSADICVLFSDIESFTTLSESVGADMLLELLEAYFSEMTTIVLQNQGTLDKYIGDAIMAFWGMPIPLEDHVSKGVLSAIQMQKRLAELQVEWMNRGFPKIRTRIGLNSGKALVGNIGSPNARVSYTALGDTVNLGSRLEALNKYYGTYLMISDSVYNHCSASFLCRPLDCVTVVGKSEPTKIYEVLCHMDEATKEQIDLCDLFEQALAAYLSCNFKAARAKFESYLGKAPNDAHCKVMIKRCKHFQQKPPDGDWNGVFNQQEK